MKRDEELLLSYCSEYSWETLLFVARSDSPEWVSKRTRYNKSRDSVCTLSKKFLIWLRGVRMLETFYLCTQHRGHVTCGPSNIACACYVSHYHSGKTGVPTIKTLCAHFIKPGAWRLGSVRTQLLQRAHASKHIIFQAAHPLRMACARSWRGLNLRFCEVLFVIGWAKNVIFLVLLHIFSTFFTTTLFAQNSYKIM